MAFDLVEKSLEISTVFQIAVIKNIHQGAILPTSRERVYTAFTDVVFFCFNNVHIPVVKLKQNSCHYQGRGDSRIQQTLFSSDPSIKYAWIIPGDTQILTKKNVYLLDIVFESELENPLSIFH